MRGIRESPSDWRIGSRMLDWQVAMRPGYIFAPALDSWISSAVVSRR